MLLVAAIGGLGSSMGLADVFIDEVFERYTFHPHLLADPVRDDELGFLLADLRFVPVACASLLVLLPRHRSGLVIAVVALLAGVEVLFVRAGLFSYNGCNVGYSMIAYGVRFAIAAWWSSHFERAG